METLRSVVQANGLVVAFLCVGLSVWLSYWLSRHFTRGRIHGSAIAIILGLLAAYFAGLFTGGSRGVADIGLLAGIGLMGGGMMRDFGIVSTAFGVHLQELRKAGVVGIVSIFAGVIVSFVVGALVALAFGYTDAESITTIGAGAVTYIVGPVTGTAIGASSDVIALAVAAVDPRDDWYAAGGQPHWSEQCAVGHGIRRADGHNERSGRGACGHRSASGALRRNDSHVLHWNWLPHGPICTLLYSSCTRLKSSSCHTRKTQE